MTNEQVKADIAANLPDNTSGLITPAKLRTEMGNMVDYSDTSAAAAVAGLDIPSVLHAQVGDVFQLFYSEVARGAASVSCRCDIGTAYSRYFEVTPSAGNVGDHSLTVYMHTPDGSVLTSASTTLRVSAVPSTPASETRVAMFGDSLLEGGGWGTELIRRVVGSEGDPAGLGLSNISFVGEGLAAGNTGYGITGFGGWGWATHFGGSPTASARGWAVVATHALTAVDVGSRWSDGNTEFQLVSAAYPVPSEECVENPSFDEMPESVPSYPSAVEGFGWVFQNTNGTCVRSNYGEYNAARMLRGPGDPAEFETALRTDVTVVPGRTYRLRYYSKGAGGVIGALALNGSAGWLLSYLPTGGGAEWSKLDEVFTVPAESSTTSLRLYLAPPFSVGSSAEYAEVSLRDITPTGAKFVGGGTLSGTATLTHVSGATHTTAITVSASREEPPSVLWNAQDICIDANAWAARMGGNLDHIVIGLGWNEWSNASSGDVAATESAIGAAISILSAAFPSAKLHLLALANPSPSGGLGASFGALIDLSSYEWTRKFVADYNGRLRARASSHIGVVEVTPVFDSEHGYPSSEAPVNSRTAETEMRGLNGIHPAENGSAQIADAIYRKLCAAF